MGHSEIRYIRLEDGTQHERAPGKPRVRLITALYILLVPLLMTASFLVGRQLNPTGSIDNDIPLHTISNSFKYNRTFAEHPSDAATRAWKSLLPEQGGYFRHPELAPERSTFSVFHQLHCINGFRQGYWMVYDAAISGRKLTEDEIPFMSSPSHIRHCLDLLRQSLMCQPDLTIEVKDVEKGGVTGFGTEHQCKNWDELVSWVSQWETYGQ